MSLLEIGILWVFLGGCLVFSALRWAGTRYAQLEKEASGVFFDLPNHLLARNLLDAAGRGDYGIAYVPGGARCDFRSKTVCLGRPPGDRSFRAVFEAAHEVGHVVLGPAFWSADPRRWAAAWAAWLGGSFLAGWFGFLWPAFLLCLLPPSGAYFFWKAESAASAWAVDALLWFPAGRRAARFLRRRLCIDLCWQAAAAAGWVACFVGLTVLVFALGRWLHELA